jgi:hypothetical protein
MAIKRTKLDRKVSLTEKDGELIDLPPGWAFTIQCHHMGEVHLDFNRYRTNGREELAEQIRDVFWMLRHSLSAKSIQTYENNGLRRFWLFLDDYEQNYITNFNQIDRQVVDDFLVWLGHKISTKGKNKGNNFPINSQQKTFYLVKNILLNCKKLNFNVANKKLTFPANPFPNSNRSALHRKPYSQNEQKQIINALNADLKIIHSEDAKKISDSQIIAVHLLILGLATGRNLSCLLDLRDNSIRSHPMDGRDILITKKRRGYTSLATSLSKKHEKKEQKNMDTIPSNISEHFNFFRNWSRSTYGDAPEGLQGYLFLWRIARDERKGLLVKLQDSTAGRFVITFSKRHRLLDDEGKLLKLNISRLRPTMATDLYRRTRDVRRVQMALGHAQADTTLRYYVTQPLESERDYAFIINSMVSQFSKTEVEGKVMLAADGSVPLENIKNLMSGGYNTGIARCQNPFRENESVCKKFLTCFRCPNMCVFEDDLWRLLSFYYRLLAERSKINPNHWAKTYAPIIRRIDIDILPNFSSSVVALAKEKAQKDPHPTWRSA